MALFTNFQTVKLIQNKPLDIGWRGHNPFLPILHRSSGNLHLLFHPLLGHTCGLPSRFELFCEFIHCFLFSVRIIYGISKGKIFIHVARRAEAPALMSAIVSEEVESGGVIGDFTIGKSERLAAGFSYLVQILNHLFMVHDLDAAIPIFILEFCDARNKFFVHNFSLSSFRSVGLFFRGSLSLCLYYSTESVLCQGVLEKFSKKLSLFFIPII